MSVYIKFEVNWVITSLDDGQKPRMESQTGICMLAIPMSPSNFVRRDNNHL